MADFDYYTYQINSVSQGINEEIDFFENTLYAETTPIAKYIAYLKKRITPDKYLAAQITHYDKLGNRQEIKRMNLNDYAKDMDELMFKRPWNKMREFHKQMKIKEFIDELKYNKKVSETNINKNRNELKEEIIDGLKNKKFGKNKSEVVYDPDTKNIISISCLYLNKKKGIWEIDWD